MKKIKFDIYNDGMMQVSENKEIFDSNNNAIKKELIEKNRFFFSYSNIRESDKYKLDTNSTASLKVKVRINNHITSNNLITIDNKIYGIEFIDKNKNNLFLYLKDYIDELDKIIEIYSISKANSLNDPIPVLFKKVFSNIKSNLKESNENNSTQTSKNIKFKIKFIDELVKNNSTTKFEIKFEERFYDIKSIVDIDEQHEILEIEGVSK